MRRLLCLLLFPAVAMAQVRETITVARILLDVRVTTGNGEPVRGLTREDFLVEVDGVRAEIESLEWIDDSAAAAALRASEHADDANQPEGRLFVVFIQTDFARNEVRIRGQMDFLRYAEKLVDELYPEDRVAVFSFDSHLKFRLDFTSDKAAVAAAMRAALRTDQPEPPPIVPNPAMASRLDREAMRKVASSEAALTLVGDALRPIPGPKSLLLMGWGLGELSNGMVRMKPEYTIARRALDASRTSIFALDTTHADSHSLEVGLQQAAKETGGFYAKTHLFPQIAVDRLRRVLEGHYELEVRRPGNAKARTVSVRVKRRGVEVLAPTTY
jgi:VWFA-related protein